MIDTHSVVTVDCVVIGLINNSHERANDMNIDDMLLWQVRCGSVLKELLLRREDGF